jgi:hypothetical protein
MSYFLVEYKSKDGKTINGIYDTYEGAELFILSCLQNNLIENNAKILTFSRNSSYKTNETNVTINNKINKNEPEKQTIVEKQETNMKQNVLEKQEDKKNQEDLKKIANDPVIMEKSKQMIDLQHKINMLKVQKKKIDESKKSFDHDINLFNKFYEAKLKNTTFIIPELFESKYNIIKKLKDDNNLTWENFINENNKVSENNNYDGLFNLNSYEESFLSAENKKDSIEEEMDIETDSEVETSDDE